jgi:hypothetical protein
MYQTTLELGSAVRFPTGFLTKAWAEFLLAVRNHVVVDALFSFALVVLPMVAMVLLMFLIGSADSTAAVADAMDGTGMLILPPWRWKRPPVVPASGLIDPTLAFLRVVDFAKATAKLLGRLWLTGHHVLHETDYNRQDGTAHTTTDQLADNRTRVEATSGRTSERRDQGLQNLSAASSPNGSGNRISERAKIIVF